MFDFILPEYADAVRKSMVEVREKGGYSRVEVEIQISDKNGRLRWVEFIVSAIKDEGGGISSEVMVLKDITSKKELEKRVKESEELYKILAENSQAGIFVIQDNNIIYMNRAAEHYMGYTKEELGDNYYFEKNVRREVRRILDRIREGKSDIYQICY